MNQQKYDVNIINEESKDGQSLSLDFEQSRKIRQQTIVDDWRQRFSDYLLQLEARYQNHSLVGFWVMTSSYVDDSLKITVTSKDCNTHQQSFVGTSCCNIAVYKNIIVRDKLKIHKLFLCFLSQFI